MNDLEKPCCAPSRGAAKTEGTPSAPERAVRAAGRHPGLIDLPGGVFRMGSEDPDSIAEDCEGPVRPVAVAPFAIAAATVTNARFATFVKATGHVTDAERFGWSYVFHLQVPDAVRRSRPPVPAATPWWLGVAGAYWKAPRGPGSGVTRLSHHPVVHVSHSDALAYCTWSGTRLPTEAEWEYAARGGLDQARFPWGDALEPGGRHHCNVFQGRFPYEDTGDDGYAGTAPVKSYRPNAYGLYNVAGNVWEWCADRFAAGAEERVLKGGSYLCHASYCNRYRLGARSRNTPDSTSGNTGFRVSSGISAGTTRR